MNEKGFNLADVLKGVSNLGTEREQIEYIDIDRIDDDPNNFYELSGIEELAANIELIGLQQPVRVRPNPDDPDRVVIVSGHRRRAAVRLLVEEGKESFREIPCIRERGDASAAMQELRLIYANSDTRKLSSADLGKQAARVEELLYKLKEEGVEFPGRMRDHVAQACQMSKSKLARLKVIREKLVFDLKYLYENNQMSESVAYALAQQPHQVQRIIAAHPPQNGWSEHYVRVCVSRIEKWEQFGDQCGLCGHKEDVLVRIFGAPNTWTTVACETVTCCRDCYNLASCINPCYRCLDKQKRLKQEKREAKAKERAEQKEMEAPRIRLIANIWQRFGEARCRVGLDIDEAMQKIGRPYYGKPEDVLQKESGNHKFKESDTLPFGFSYRLNEADVLLKAADAFGCSVDYLLCRTDVPNLGTVSMPEGWVPLQWIDGRERPKRAGQKAVAYFQENKDSFPWRDIAEWNGVCWIAWGTEVEDKCVRWFPIPDHDEGVCG